MKPLAAWWPRALRRPGLPLLLLVLSAAAIAVNTTAFAALYTLLWKPLPYADADRLVAVRARLEQFDVTSDFSPGFLRQLDATPGPWTATAGYDLPLDERSDASGRSWRVVAATPSLWPTLGVAAGAGRVFDARDAAQGADVVVLSDAAWRARFAGDPAAIGGTLDLDGRRFQVIGVMPPGFAFPDAGVDAWLPLQPAPSAADAGVAAIGSFGIVARLAADGSPQAAEAAVESLVARDPTVASTRTIAGLRASVVPLRSLWSDVDLRALALLQGAALLLLGGLLVNLVNLIHARIARDAPALRTRAALGATTGRLVRAAMAEVAWPVGLGCAAALALVPAGGALLRAQGLLPEVSPLDVGGDAPTVAFTLALGACLVAVTAAAAAWSVRHRLPASAAITQVVRGTGAVRTRYALVAAQLVLGTAVLGAGALLLRSVYLLNAEDIGFERANLVVVGVDPIGLLEGEAGAVSEDTAGAAPVLRRLREAFVALPGVQQVGVGQTVPFGEAQIVGRFRHPGSGEDLRVRRTDVDAGYLDALGIPRLAGAGFDAAVVEDAAIDPVVVDTRFVSRYFPDLPDPAAAVGMTLAKSDAPGAVRIAGVVRAVRSAALERDDELPMVYRQRAEVGPLAYFVLRTAGDPAPLVEAARAVVAREAPDGSLLEAATMDLLVDRTLAQRVGLLRLIGVFAAVAVALSVVALFAVLAFLVGERVTEFAVRLAVGARTARLAASVLGRALVLAALALPPGIVAGIALVRTSGAPLHRVDAADAATWAAVAATMLALSAAAALLPAWRAARTDPMRVLKAP